jgi:hypothetical protein
VGIRQNGLQGFLPDGGVWAISASGSASRPCSPLNALLHNTLNKPQGVAHPKHTFHDVSPRQRFRYASSAIEVGATHIDDPVKRIGN